MATFWELLICKNGIHAYIPQNVYFDKIQLYQFKYTFKLDYSNVQSVYLLFWFYRRFIASVSYHLKT